MDPNGLDPEEPEDLTPFEAEGEYNLVHGKAPSYEQYVSWLESETVWEMFHNYLNPSYISAPRETALLTYVNHLYSTGVRQEGIVENLRQMQDSAYQSAYFQRKNATLKTCG